MFLPIFKMQIKCICGDSADDTGLKTCTSTLKSSHLKSALVLKALTCLAMSSSSNNKKSQTFRLTQHFPTQVLRQKPERSCGGRRPETHPLGTNIFSLERGGFGSAPLSTTLGWRRRRVRPSLPSQIDEPAQTSLETNADAGTRGRRFKPRPAGGGNVNSVSVPMVFSRFQERRKRKKKNISHMDAVPFLCRHIKIKLLRFITSGTAV